MFLCRRLCRCVVLRDDTLLSEAFYCGLAEFRQVWVKYVPFTSVAQNGRRYSCRGRRLDITTYVVSCIAGKKS